jgi:hypothetical protein
MNPDGLVKNSLWMASKLWGRLSIKAIHLHHKAQRHLFDVRSGLICFAKPSANIFVFQKL